jgi:hypothetical protein
VRSVPERNKFFIFFCCIFWTIDILLLFFYFFLLLFFVFFYFVMAEYVKDGLTWGCCVFGLQDNKYVDCMKCKKAFHIECISMTDDQEELATSTWLCPLCHDSGRKGNKDDTPVRYNPNITVRPGKRQALNSPPTNDNPITTKEMQGIIEGVMSEIRNTMRSTITEILGAELRSLKEEISDVKESMNFINLKYETITKEHEESANRVKHLEEENCALQLKVDDLSHRMNQMEQTARSNNIEIQCMPEKKDENLLSIITELGRTINCHISSEHLAHYTRIAKLKRDTDRPRSIVVQFNSPRMRDQFLAAVIRFNKSKPYEKLNSSHAGLPGTKIPIFVCEHLSPTNKALHAAARHAAREKGYKYVWVRNGRIYMRKSDDTDYKVIRNIDTLHKLP